MRVEKFLGLAPLLRSTYFVDEVYFATPTKLVAVVRKTIWRTRFNSGRDSAMTAAFNNIQLLIVVDRLDLIKT